ncbi:MAG: hypothetical protein AAF431_07260 [Pseudomonadota bacterium]
MNSLIVGLKREYWEYRKIVIGVPILLCVFVFLGSTISTLIEKGMDHSDHRHEQTVAEVVEGAVPDVPKSPSDAASDEESDSETKQPKLSAAEERVRAPYKFTAIFMGFAWLISLYYLLGCLHTDRKDKSILYWKSMPVSETRNVLTKMLFGGVCITAIALIAAWAMYFVLTVFGLGVLNSSDGGETWEYAERTFSVSKLIIWPLTSLVLGAIWAAPLFAYLLMVSAAAKRSPFMLLVLPLMVLLMLESMIFGSQNLVGSLMRHMPFVILESLSDSVTYADFLHNYFVQHGASLVSGLVFAGLFVAAAVWFRNNRFEV